MTDLAPIALFVYNRPQHTRQTLEALSENMLAAQSILYIFADGQKKETSVSQQENIDATRKVLREKKWCGDVIIIEREQNLGLAQNVISGISEVIDKHGAIIVLEDDLLTSPYFLQYCNEGLKVYKENKNVYAINAYQFDLSADKFDTFLSPMATSSWGWATWADRWKAFDWNMEAKSHLESNTYLRSRFNLADYDYTTMLQNKNSWAIRWYYSVFMRNGIGLFPTRTLITNVGFDGTGTHKDNKELLQNRYDQPISIEKKETISLEWYGKSLNYFSSQQAPVSLWRRVLNKLKSIGS